MNTNQKKYTAFMESVCKEFNCPEMLPALNAGFKAFCESTMVDLPGVKTKLTRTMFGKPYTKSTGEDHWTSPTGVPAAVEQVNDLASALRAEGITPINVDAEHNSVTCKTNNGFEVKITFEPYERMTVSVSNPALKYDLEQNRALFKNGKFTEDSDDALDFAKSWLKEIEDMANELDFPIAYHYGHDDVCIGKWHTIPLELRKYIPDAIRAAGDERREEAKAQNIETFEDRMRRHGNVVEPWDRADEPRTRAQYLADNPDD